MMRVGLLLTLSLAVLGLMPSLANGAMAQISGTITPTHWQGDQAWKVADFGIIADTTHVVNAQSQTVMVTGTIGALPLNTAYWLELGLVPKSVYDNPDYGFLPYIFNKGVTLYTEYDGTGFEVGLLDQQSDPDSIFVYPVANDGSISFSFTLTPSGGGGGGSGGAIVDGTVATKGALTTMPYTQDLTQCYLVGMVWVGGGALSPVNVSAEVLPEPATLSLLGLGLAGLAAKRRRAK